MSAQFTPGPWFADAKGYVWRRPPHDLYQNGGGVAGDKPIAVVHRGWYGDDLEGYPVDANARLIAEAPVLLNALRDLEICANTVDACYTRNPGNFALALRVMMDSAKRARDVFAKVTGGQP